MLTLLGSLLGFLGSAFPQLLKLIQDSHDRKHELAILDRQMELQRQGHSQRLDEIRAEGEIGQSLALYRHDQQPAGYRWVEALRASVRPVLTYAFFLLFAAVKISGLYAMTRFDGLSLTVALPLIWDAETQALFAATMSFWFGLTPLTIAKFGRSSPQGLALFSFWENRRAPCHPSRNRSHQAVRGLFGKGLHLPGRLSDHRLWPCGEAARAGAIRGRSQSRTG
jgi:hypothetical protein